MVAIPAQYLDLLERPLIGGLATVRPDGQPESSPMWFLWDSEMLRFTHTTYRKKLSNLDINPHVSLLIVDPDDPYRYLQIRGRVHVVTPDPTGAFFAQLAAHYGRGTSAPPDAAQRVIITVAPTAASYTNYG